MSHPTDENGLAVRKVSFSQLMGNTKNEETTIGGDTAARTTPVPSLTMKMLHKWVAEMLVPYKIHTSCAKSYVLTYRDVEGDVVNLVSDMDIMNALQNGRATNSRTVEIKLHWIGEIMTKEELWKRNSQRCGRLMKRNSRLCCRLMLVLVLLFFFLVVIYS